MTIKGTMHVIMPTQQVSEKFAKRDFVIETEGEYKQLISVQVSQDKCALLDNFKLGDEVEAHINLRGRAWTNPQGETKYFNTIESWKLNKLGVAAAEPVQASNHVVGNDEQSLPF